MKNEIHTYNISLDIGSNSIGFVVLGLNSETLVPESVLDLGVRIFNDGRDAKTKTPLAVERRVARGIRRNRDRKKNRIKRLISELSEFNVLSSHQSDRDKVFELCPYESRKNCVEGKVGCDELARALIHIANHRGFKSNRLSGDPEDSKFFQRIDSLSEILQKKTLGQFLYERKRKNTKKLKEGKNKELLPLRFKPIENQFYPSRQMLIDEFSLIKQIQKGHLTDEQWDAIEETIFWQYPLKPVEKGRCRFFPNEYRAHSELPICHEFRILQDLNNLKYMSEGKQYDLDGRQRSHLIRLLNKQKTVSFKSLLRLKDENKSPIFPNDAKFNLDTPTRNGKLLGNSTLIDLCKPNLLGELANRLPYKSLNEVVKHIIEPIKVVTDKKGNNQKVVEEFEETVTYLKNLVPELTYQQVRVLARYTPQKSTTNLSIKFLELIIPYMREGLKYHDAVTKVVNEEGIAFHHSQSNIMPNHDKLPYYGEILTDSVSGQFNQLDQNKPNDQRDNDAYEHGKIANPSVHIALNQLRKVVNHIIGKQGAKPTKISIELTRDLKNSLKKRKEIERKISKNAKENERIRKEITNIIGSDKISREDIQKFKLWEELGVMGARQCVFTGRTISATQLFNGTVEIEHIIPFSRCYDDGVSNKTLSFKDANNLKLNKTPHEAFGNLPEYHEIMQRALRAFGQTSKYERFKQGAFESFYGEHGSKNFIERQLNDTKFITKAARTYLSCLIPEKDIIPVNGQMTAILRKVWGLNHFKNRESGSYRDDHRHHIVDAFVVGLTNRSLIKQVNTLNARSNNTDNSLLALLKNRTSIDSGLKANFMQRLEGVVASHKRDHGIQGSLFNDTAYGYDKENNTYVTRKKIEELSVDELFKIRDRKIRQDIFEYLINRADVENKKEFNVEFKNSGEKLDKKLLQFVELTGHKKVRVDVKNESVKIIESAPYKGYALNSYSYVDIWRIPKQDKKTGGWTFIYKGDFVETVKAKSYLRDNKTRPHHAAKFIMRLFKQDGIRLVDTETGEANNCRIAGFSASNNKLDIRGNLDTNSSKQKFESINKIFNSNRVEKIRTY